MIKVINDPIATVIAAATAVKPDIETEIDFVEATEDGYYGCTLFADDGSFPTIHISTLTPLEHLAEIIGHELAHVIAGVEAEHGEEWEAAFQAIAEEFKRMVEDG